MSLPDPQSVTVNAVAQSLPRIAPGETKSVYRKDDGTYTLTVSRVLGDQNKAGTRSTYRIRLDHRKTVSDPFVVANNIPIGASVTFLMEMPTLGYTNVEVKDMLLGLSAWATSATVLTVIGGQT